MLDKRLVPVKRDFAGQREKWTLEIQEEHKNWYSLDFRFGDCADFVGYIDEAGNTDGNDLYNIKWLYVGLDGEDPENLRLYQSAMYRFRMLKSTMQVCWFHGPLSSQSIMDQIVDVMTRFVA